MIKKQISTNWLEVANVMLKVLYFIFKPVQLKKSVEYLFLFCKFFYYINYKRVSE